MSPKVGRPAGDNPKKLRFEIRISENDMILLDELSKETGKSKAELLLDGLHMLADSIKK